ncbi:DUF4328 domain-containing protein [Streptacidiphilus fuscans]|uniref:DUF4328 domain-containing protein n=1 Tax=Streptacidiphilus fuscans TaxID=2789292 RepID=A0A931B454_9ACTN|nr:DUF4328 domain-containing protein [Streptacidiphilus fuscans]MBF9070870.1 DUF4328 domain-containing protein [Streptacidiphilus fuscans]
MLCPTCSAATLDFAGRCPNCGYIAGHTPQSYGGHYAQPTLIAPTAPVGIGIAAQVLIVVNGLLALLSFGLNIWSFTVAKSALDTDGINVSAISATQAASSVLLFLAMLANLAAGVVFIIWFFKSARLAEILAPGRQALSTGWAVGGWFIPLAFLVLPRIVAGGIWRAAVPLEQVPSMRRPRTYLVTWWWLSFCVAQVFWMERVTPAISWATADGSLARLVVTYGLTGTIDLFAIAATVLAVVMIRKVTSMQQVRILQGPGLGHPYAAPMQAPYAAYAESGMPQAGAYAAPQYTPVVPAQAVAPAAVPVPAATPAQAQAEPAVELKKEPAQAEPLTQAEPVRVDRPTTPLLAVPEDAVPKDATPQDAAPEDTVAQEVEPTVDAPKQDTATVMFRKPEA